MVNFKKIEKEEVYTKRRGGGENQYQYHVFQTKSRQDDSDL